MTSKGPQPTASIEDNGTAGPWSFSASRGIPTAAKVERAQREAVGGARKRCRMGKNCSAACISQGKVCLVEFPAPIQNPLSQVRNYIVRRNQIKPGSIQERRIDAALGQMGGVAKVTGEGKMESKTGLVKPDVEWKSEKKRAERTGLPYKDIQDLKKRRQLLSDAEEREGAMKALHKDATSRGLRLPKAELQMIYEALPKGLQDALARNGKAEGGWYAGRDENGNAIFSKKPSKERALAVLDLWLRQGGTDAYLSRGGKVWAPSDLSIEHVIPMSKGGQDIPSNWVLIRKGTNTARNSKRLGDWIDRLPGSKEAYKNYLTTYKTEKRRAQATKARARALDPKSIDDQDLFKKGGKTLAQIFREENGGKTPSIFTKEWLGLTSTGGRMGNAGPPAPFAKGLGLVAKTNGLNSARNTSIALRNVWNNEWKGDGSISKQEAFTKMMAQMQKDLTADQFNNIFAPAANDWAQKNGFL